MYFETHLFTETFFTDMNICQKKTLNRDLICVAFNVLSAVTTGVRGSIVS
jgi:hypothetical protein